MRILVVDDEESGRAFLKALFAAHGHEVVEAADGEQALRLALADPPDVVISDILMPVMDGYHLCLEWRQEETLRDLPFIFYTASYTDSADEVLAKNMGVDAFILKPAEPAELIRVLDDVMAEVASGRIDRAAYEQADATTTLREYSERLVKKLEAKVLESHEANEDLRVAHGLLNQEMEVKNELIERLHLDVEERMLVEAELRSERDLTSHIIEVADMAIVGLDLEGRIEIFSQGAEAITGYSADEVLGLDWFVTMLPISVRADHHDHVKKLIRGAGPIHVMGVVLTKEGRERILEWSDTVREDGSGKIVGVLGFGLDVTERIRQEVSENALARLTDAVLFDEAIEEALLGFCGRLARTLRFGLVALLSEDPDGGVDMRAAAGPLTETATIEASDLGRVVRSLADRAMNDGTAVDLDEDAVDPAATHPGPDTADIRSGLAVTLIASGRTFGALVFLADHAHAFTEDLVTLLQATAERTALVLLLAESQRQLRLQSAALRSAASAMMVVGADGTLEWANPAYERLTGRSMEQDVGRRADLFRVSEDGRDHAEFRQILAEGRPTRVEIESVSADGTPFNEQVTVDPVCDRSGKVTHFVVVRQDITERKKFEQLKSDFLSMVSHELRTPLTSIIGYTDLLIRDTKDAENDRGHQFAERIRSHSGDMQGLIEELLEVSRMQTGTALRLAARPVRLEDVIRQSAGSVLLTEKHSLVFEIGDDLPDVICDPERIGHVVSNLVSNAVKYSPAGGKIVVGLTVTGEVARLTVADSGIGIDPADTARIFDRFTQADMSVTREFGGFGLGLFIVRSLVEAHHGSVSVDSRIGVGTTFTVEIPLEGPVVRTE